MEHKVLALVARPIDGRQGHRIASNLMHQVAGEHGIRESMAFKMELSKKRDKNRAEPDISENREPGRTRAHTHTEVERAACRLIYYLMTLKPFGGNDEHNHIEKCRSVNTLIGCHIGNLPYDLARPRTSDKILARGRCGLQANVIISAQRSQ